MHWLYLILSLALFGGAYKASGWWVLLLLLGSLVAFVAWMLGWLSARISSGARSEMQILSPEELQQLREQAAARKAASAAKPESPQS
jgi:ABC-type transport system involved in cytochrome bd biosynthesis fused ATPase/permease subunit